jgi:GNAT superfamily N-acetyltransferase
MPLPIIAREAQHQDAAAITLLWRRFMAEETDAVPDADPEAAFPGWQERLHSQIARRMVVLLQEGPHIVGFASFIDSAGRPWVPTGVAYLVDLYLQPESRRGTAAGRLFTALASSAAAAGCTEMWTNTNLRNRRVQLLLRRGGFLPNPGFEIPALQDQLYFRKKLA